jgi:hypothetical protein
MERRKSFEEMAAYIRSIRPSQNFLEFDRMIRTVLFWLDTHKIRELKVFLAQEGKEYSAFTDYVSSTLGEPPNLTPDFIKSMVRFAGLTS